MKNIFGDQGNMEQNFWEQESSEEVNFGEHLDLFLRNKGTTVNFHREKGNKNPPPPGRPAVRFLSKQGHFQPHFHLKASNCKMVY